MATREIPRDEWVRSLDTFSKQHENWIVSVEVLAADLGDQEEVNGLPLVGVSADVKDAESRIEVIVGGREDANLNRIIERPRRLWIREAEDPAREAVAVESDDGTMTIVHFNHIPPEQAERLLPGK